MANLNRILGMASKAIDKQLQKRGQGERHPAERSRMGPTGAASCAAPRTS